MHTRHSLHLLQPKNLSHIKHQLLTTHPSTTTPTNTISPSKKKITPSLQTNNVPPRPPLPPPNPHPHPRPRRTRTPAPSLPPLARLELQTHNYSDQNCYRYRPYLRADRQYLCSVSEYDRCEYEHEC